MVGNGCIRGRPSLYVRKFVEKTGICSMNTFMAKGVISDKSDRHLHTIGIREADHASIAMREADLVIAIGYDLVEYSPKHWNGSLDKKIIHIDFTPAESDTYYPPTIEIAADIEYTMYAILEEIERIRKQDETEEEKQRQYRIPHSDPPELFKTIKREIVWRLERYKNDFSYPIKPEKLVLDVRDALDESDIVISDVGVHKLWIAKIYNTYTPNTCIVPNGFCSMGFALPAAIAAQLVDPSHKIVAMCGDGGFLMNVQEIETAVRLRLPIIVIVWCDYDYGMISLKQIYEFGRSAFTKFNNPNFVKLAESFGAIGYNVRSTEEFSKVLRKGKSVEIESGHNIY